MLEKITLSAIYSSKKDCGITIDPVNGSANLKKCYGDEEVLQIILDNIGIQISLADIILKCGVDDELESQISYYYLSDDEKERNSDIICIFGGIHKVFDKRRRVIAYEVYSPTSQACRLFKMAHDKKMLDKWIYVFYSKKVVEDCTDIELFRYCSKEISLQRVQMMKNERFFKYVLNAGDCGVASIGLRISQYSLSEINQVPFIEELASIVNNLYVIVFREKKKMGDHCYGKMLSWD